MKPRSWEIFIRSLFIQASLNQRKMQNLGFAFSILPAARGFAQDKGKMKSFLNRHLDRFNTHPYLAGAIIASAVRLEGDLNNDQGEAVVSLKSVLAPPYAAIGDTFFWGALRTFTALSAVIIAFNGSAWAPLAFVAVYNFFHCYIRYEGFKEGYRRGRQGYDYIGSLDLPRAGGYLRMLSLMLLGGLALPVTGMAAGRFLFSEDLFVRFGLLLLILVFYSLIKRGVSTLLIFYLMVAVTMVAPIIL
ncbi:MAG: PTS system mannose/fructose/sorbose family transporter subunit IID [Smithellaceae bacterium]|nr:PTS system mannose/fructose/sorbose family transporter subunit IID [Smithellaceae bacterium]